jgi:hypothetical protein
MSDIKVTTNNVPRDVIDAWQLTPAERAEFDYLDWNAIMDGRDSASFFRYKGQLYDLGNFMRLDGGPLTDAGWQGASADSAFSATLVRYVNGQVVIGWYCC